MSERVWIEPSRPDVEATAIKRLLTEAGETVVASWDDPAVERIRCGGGAIYAIEREDWPAWTGHPDPQYTDCGAIVVRIDHHAPGDPGYGRPSAEFLAASSLGQVIAELARLGRLPPEQIIDGRLAWSRGPSLNGPGMYGPPAGVIRHRHRADVSPIGACQSCWHALEPDPAGVRAVAIPDDLVLTAAADHCLGAAYRGECPGVDPDALMRWRVETRAAHQGRSVDEVLADIEQARAALEEAPLLQLAYEPCEWHSSHDPAIGDCVNARGTEWADKPCRYIRVRDVRGQHVPELPEAGTRYGISYVADGLSDPDGRVKIVCSGDAEVIRNDRKSYIIEVMQDILTRQWVGCRTCKGYFPVAQAATHAGHDVI